MSLKIYAWIGLHITARPCTNLPMRGEKQTFALSHQPQHNIPQETLGAGVHSCRWFILWGEVKQRNQYLNI